MAWHERRRELTTLLGETILESVRRLQRSCLRELESVYSSRTTCDVQGQVVDMHERTCCASNTVAVVVSNTQSEARWLFIAAHRWQSADRETSNARESMLGLGLSRRTSGLSGSGKYRWSPVSGLRKKTMLLVMEALVLVRLEEIQAEAKLLSRVLEEDARRVLREKAASSMSISGWRYLTPRTKLRVTRQVVEPALEQLRLQGALDSSERARELEHVWSSVLEEWHDVDDGEFYAGLHRLFVGSNREDLLGISEVEFTDAVLLVMEYYKRRHGSSSSSSMPRSSISSSSSSTNTESSSSSSTSTTASYTISTSTATSTTPQDRDFRGEDAGVYQIEVPAVGGGGTTTTTTVCLPLLMVTTESESRLINSMGRVSVPPLQHYPCWESKAQYVFDYYDADRDGLLNFKENNNLLVSNGGRACGDEETFVSMLQQLKARCPEYGVDLNCLRRLYAGINGIPTHPNVHKHFLRISELCVKERREKRSKASRNVVRRFVPNKFKRQMPPRKRGPVVHRKGLLDLMQRHSPSQGGGGDSSGGRQREVGGVGFGG